jgi:hypothetical protein
MQTAAQFQLMGHGLAEPPLLSSRDQLKPGMTVAITDDQRLDVIKASSD